MVDYVWNLKNKLRHTFSDRFVTDQLINSSHLRTNSAEKKHLFQFTGRGRE